jgi:hypothetical protein
LGREEGASPIVVEEEPGRGGPAGDTFSKGEGEDRRHRQWRPGLPGSICTALAEEGAVGPYCHPLSSRPRSALQAEAAAMEEDGDRQELAARSSYLPCSRPPPAPCASRRHGRPVPWGSFATRRRAPLLLCGRRPIPQRHRVQEREMRR